MVLPEVTMLAEARDAIRDLAEENEKLSNEQAWFRRQFRFQNHYCPVKNPNRLVKIGTCPILDSVHTIDFFCIDAILLV